MISSDQCPVCIERPVDGPGMVWVQCDVCSQWFHADCVAMSARDVAGLHSYHCARCAALHGPSVGRRKLKRARVKIDYVALNEGDTFAVDKSEHPHVASFLEWDRDGPKKDGRGREPIGPKDLLKNDGPKGLKNGLSDGLEKEPASNDGLKQDRPNNEVKKDPDSNDGLEKDSGSKDDRGPDQLKKNGPTDGSNPGPVTLAGPALTKAYALASRLERPVLVPNVSGAGMLLPCPRTDITVQYITDAVDEDTPVEVMDVLSQQSVRPGWSMAQWRDYFYTPADARDRIYNVISLEVSHARGLGADFVRPQLVRDMDLVDRVWPRDDPQPRPKVTTYCLMSVQGSYTDFHIDFSGTCVYYTVCRGAKSFLMFPPTDDNLALYTQWCLEPNQNFLWFADYAKPLRGKSRRPTGGFSVTLHENDLFIIPSGWIHSVYTPQDSVVIGGNYLLVANLDMHLKITDIERKTNVPAKFRFPMFNKVLWLTAYYYLHHQSEFVADVAPAVIDLSIKSESTAASTAASDLLRRLIDHLYYHLNLSKSSPKAHKSIPFHLIGKDAGKFVAQLESWLTHL